MRKHLNVKGVFYSQCFLFFFFKCHEFYRKSQTAPSLTSLWVPVWSSRYLILSSLYYTSSKSLCGSVCVRLPDFTHLSFRPPAPPRCGLSDAPTRCCTWSRSAWRASPCSRDWRVCSWRCSLPRVQTGSEVRAREGPRGRSPVARSGWGNHRRLSLREEGERKKRKVKTATVLIREVFLQLGSVYRLALRS